MIKETIKIRPSNTPKVIIKNVPGDRIQDSMPKAVNIPPPPPKPKK